jgi:hypothetical protein
VMATGLATRKRRRRKLRALAMSSCGAAACLFLVMRIHSAGENPAGSRDMVEADAVPPSVKQSQEVPPTEIQAEREKDEALLNTLSEAGPIIITMADGSRQLYLTRP